MLAVVDDAAVDLVRKDDEVALPGDAGDGLEVVVPEDRPGRVARAVDHDQPGPVRDERSQLVGVGPEAVITAQRQGDGGRAHEPRHRLVDREAWVGHDDLVASPDEGHHREREHRLGARGDDDAVGVDLDPAPESRIGGDRLTEGREPERRGVVGPAFIERPFGCGEDVRRGVEVGLSEVEMDDVAALRFESARPIRRLEGGLGPDVVHPASQSHRDRC